MHSILEQLRYHLEAPGAEAWEAICALLEQLEGAEALPFALRYVEERVGGELAWEEAPRAVPQRWLDRLWEGEALPAASRLCRSLVCTRGGLSEVEVVRLLSRAALVGLRVLDVSDNLTHAPPSAMVWPVVASAPWLGALVELIAQSNGLGDEGVEALFGGVALRRLQRLDLTGNSVTAQGVTALARRLAGSPLRRLELRWNLLGDPGVRALVKAPWLGELEALGLYGCMLGPTGAATLAAAPWAGALRALDLGGNNLDDEGVIALAGGAGLASLERLDLSDVRLGGAGVEAVVYGPWGERLQELRLSGNRLGRDDLQPLLEQGRLPSLRRLVLHDTALTCDDASAWGALRERGVEVVLDEMGFMAI